MPSAEAAIQPENERDALLLMRFFKNGDRAAMEELFLRHADAAYRLAFAIVGQAADAEEIVQAAFLKILRNEAPRTDHVRGWIMRIVVNTGRDHKRGEARRRERQEAASANRPFRHEADAERAEMIAQALKAVRALPEKYRLPVLLHHVEGLSFREVGKVLSLPEDTVSKHSSLGLEQVRQTLAASGITAGALLPGLLASMSRETAPVALTESLKALIAALPAGANTAQPVQGGMRLMAKISIGLTLAAAATAAALVWSSGKAADQPAGKEDPPTDRIGAGPEAWAQWRGPNRDGIVTHSPKLLDRWPKDGPKLLWKSGPIPASWNGGGMSGVAVADGRVYVYASWHRPVDGGEVYRPFTAEILRDWGYIPDMPEALAKKIEAGRLEAKKISFKAGYHLLDYWYPEKQQIEAAEQLLKDNPEMAKYVQDFLATLDPKDAEKYGTFVKRRFCNRDTGSGDHPITLENLAKLNAMLLNKETKNFGAGTRFIPEPLPKFVFSESETAIASAWDRASKTTDTILCLDAGTGKELWKKEFPSKNWPKDGLMGYLGSASTPAVSGDKVFVSGNAGLYCLSAKDGALLWQVKGEPNHGSVLVAEGVVVFPGGNAAYDTETGKELWKGGACKGSSPVLRTVDGKSMVIIGDSWLDLHTGKPVYTLKGFDVGYGLTPVVSGEYLVGSGQVYKMSPQSAEILWRKSAFEPAASPLVYQDHLYMFSSWYGGNGWHCFDIKTGDEKWKQPDPKVSQAGDCTCSSAIVADGKIIHPIGGSHGGQPFQLEMIRATPEKFEQLGVFDPGIAPMSSPAFASGKLYLRLANGVACYDLTEAGNK